MTMLGGPHPKVSAMPFTVLVVDDVDEMRYLARTVLEQGDGWDVVGEAKNGLEAVAMVEQLRPDVVLLDLEMPWLSGAECVPLIRELSPETHVVLWTVDPASPRARTAEELGATGVVDKGAFPGALLLGALERLLLPAP